MKVVKEDNQVICTFSSTDGYLIRLKKYRGAVITVGFDHTVSIGQYTKFKYTLADWELLQSEISEGIHYLTEISNFITKDKLIPNTIYKTDKSKLVLYLGFGKFEDSLNDSEVYGYIDDTDIFAIQEKDGVLYFPCFVPSFKCRKHAPSNLVEVVKTFGDNITTYKSSLGVGLNNNVSFIKSEV